MNDLTRRAFLERAALAAGGVAALPLLGGCASQAASAALGAVPVSADPLSVPPVRPDAWDPIVFNRVRGNAGVIPKTYLASINGPDGPKGHLGKHLPYVPKGGGIEVPAGYVALMWGDPGLGYVRHPNGPRTEANPDGHWYNWIRLRKAVLGEAQEVETVFSGWPATGPEDSGRYAVLGGGEMTADKGKNAVYLVKLPPDVSPGDPVRIWAHCLTHGEYVDFLTI